MDLAYLAQEAERISGLDFPSVILRGGAMVLAAVSLGCCLYQVIKSRRNGDWYREGQQGEASLRDR